MLRYHPLMSSSLMSNLFTMGVVARIDPQRAIPPMPCIPDEGTRLLRARLILEEALETIEGLGLAVFANYPSEIPQDPGAPVTMATICFGPTRDGPNLEKIVDGCCDVKYVADGTLAACGVADTPHMDEVIRANTDKFPGGVATLDANGKYGKPPGWRPPNHKPLLQSPGIDLKLYSDLFVEQVIKELPQA